MESTNNIDIELAKTLAGASDGSSSLDDVKAAIKKAIFVGDAAWFGDYQKSPAPSEYQRIHEKITKVSNLRQNALQELLKYWKDER